MRRYKNSDGRVPLGWFLERHLSGLMILHFWSGVSVRCLFEHGCHGVGQTAPRLYQRTQVVGYSSNGRGHRPAISVHSLVSARHEASVTSFWQRRK